MDKILPCPYCGSSDLRTVLVWNPYQVFCNNCHCVGGNGKSKEEAIAAWNKVAERKWTDEDVRQFALDFLSHVLHPNLITNSVDEWLSKRKGEINE